MKKAVSMVLALLMCLGLLVGCKDSQTDSSDTNSTGSAAGVDFSTADVKYFDENGESVYRITRAENDDVTISTYVFKQYKELTGLKVKNMSDTEDGTDVYEILVGQTNRPETALAKQYLIQNVGGRFQDYIICTIGKKIVIYGMTEEALMSAAEYYAANFIKTEGVKGGIKYTHATEGDFTDTKINNVNLGRFVFVKQRFNESYVVQKQLEDVNEVLANKTGYKMRIVEDNTDSAEYEIIVGDAKREGVQTTEDRDKYSIKVSGKKVYLNGGSPAARAMAVSEFSKMLSAGAITDENSITGSYSETVAKYDTSKYYIPTWVDDFDYVEGGINGIDTSKWHVMKEGENDAEGYNGRTSVRTQRSDVLFVDKGMLNCFAKYDDQYYYGFKMTTKKNMLYRYGVLEMSAILPDSGSNCGFWVSLWANSLSKDPESQAAYFTEINVVEMFGLSTVEASNCHGWLRNTRKDYYNSYWAPKGYDTHWSLDGKYTSQKKYYCPEGKFNDGLHTFSYIWDENTCAFACDGNVYFSVDLNEQEIYKETLTQPLCLILSQATGFAKQSSCLADDDPAWNTTNNFQIDYVHIYQMNDGVSELRFLK